MSGLMRTQHRSLGTRLGDKAEDEGGSHVLLQHSWPPVVVGRWSAVSAPYRCDRRSRRPLSTLGTAGEKFREATGAKEGLATEPLERSKRGLRVSSLQPLVTGT